MNKEYANEDKNKRKKEYLLAEIKDKGYDPEEYIEFLLKTKEGDNLTLDDFTLSELQGSVIQFQFKNKKKAKEQFKSQTSKMGEAVFTNNKADFEPTKSHLKKNNNDNKNADRNKQEIIKPKEELDNLSAITPKDSKNQQKAVIQDNNDTINKEVEDKKKNCDIEKQQQEKVIKKEEPKTEVPVTQNQITDIKINKGDNEPKIKENALKTQKETNKKAKTNEKIEDKDNKKERSFTQYNASSANISNESEIKADETTVKTKETKPNKPTKAEGNKEKDKDKGKDKERDKDQEEKEKYTNIIKEQLKQITDRKPSAVIINENQESNVAPLTGIVKQEKAFKPKINPEEIKKKNEELYSPFLLTAQTIQCQKQSINIFSHMKDIQIKITNPEISKSTLYFFVEYQYTIKCNNTKTQVVRTLGDFEWLRAKFVQLYPGIFIPPFPPNSYRVKNDSPKKVLYIERFINSVAKIKLLRSSNLFHDFITLAHVDFLTVKKDYDKMEKPSELNDITTKTGTLEISISKEQDARAMQISKEIAEKSLLYNKLFTALDYLLAQFDEVAKRFADVSKALHDIQGSYANSTPLDTAMARGFGQLAVLMGSWEQGYNLQKTFFTDDFKYYFKFMQKELNTFNSSVMEDLKQARTNYNYLFAKGNKKEMLTDKESKELINLQKMYGYYLFTSLDEYEKLTKKQAYRFENQFISMSENADKFTSDYNHFYLLLNFHII